jgi:RimJ/RimL family protein N-acetyltransferase
MMVNNYFGHIGLFKFNYNKRRCEIDNIVRGIENIHPGAMETSIRTMMKWARESLGVVDLYLKVFSDNERALHLYKKLGFVEVIDRDCTEYRKTVLSSGCPNGRYI